MFKLIKTTLIAFSMVTLPSMGASAEDTKNPLYLVGGDVDKERCEKAYPHETGFLTRDRILCILTEKAKPEPGSNSGRDAINEMTKIPLMEVLVPCTVPSAEDRRREAARVSIKRDQWEADQEEAKSKLIAEIASISANLEAAPEELQAAIKKKLAEYERVLADQFSEPSQLYVLENVVPRCLVDKDTLIKAPDLRFSKTSNNYFIRQSLLALFQSSEYGKRNNHVVLREEWDVTLSLPPKPNSDPNTSKQALQTLNYSESRYRPLVDQFEDDLMLILYLLGEPAFEVVKEDDNVRSLSANNTNEAAFDFRGKRFVPPVLTGFASPLDRGATFIQNAAKPKKFENPPQLTPLIRTPLTSSATLRLAVLKSPEEFSKSAKKQEGAKIGTTIDGTGDGSVLDDDKPTLTADMAIGAPYKWTRTYAYNEGRVFNPEKTELVITPFLSIDADPQTVKRLIDVNGVATAQDQIIDSATLAAGLRIDYEQTDERRSSGEDAQEGRYLSDAGRDRPGVRIGFVYEGLTDNYNLWSAQRASLQVSPPSFLLTPGYRSPFPLDSLTRDRVTADRPLSSTRRTWLDGISNGWYFEWDFAGALDYIDYSRLPRKFDENFPNLINDEAPEFGLFGGDLEFKLSKRNLFGGPNDTSWMSFEVDYTYRDGFESDTRATNHVEFSAKISDPLNDKRFFGLTYKDGFNYRTQEEDDQIGFEIGAKY